jgi:hypothetical protein
MLDETRVGRGMLSHIDFKHVHSSEFVPKEMDQDSFSTQNEALVEDRQLTRRGSTPLLDIGNPNILRAYDGRGQDDRSEEYIQLLRCVRVIIIITVGRSTLLISRQSRCYSAHV